MPNYNQITLAGHVGRDAEIRETSGKPVLGFSLAVTEKGRQGEKTEWFNVSYFLHSDSMRWLEKAIRKGSGVLVTGRLSTREYQAKDGTLRHSIDVLAREVQPLGGGHTTQSRPDDEPELPGFDDSDVPF